MQSNPTALGEVTAAPPGAAWPMIITACLWAILTVSAVALRPLLPVDETRYLTVAWEMWNRDNFLVPHLNAEPYGHKTPLLFWLMHAGWMLFGVVEIWPRLIAPLAGLACLFLTRSLGRALWPDRPAIGDLAPLLLLAIAIWPAMTTPVMFDSLLAACVLTGLLGAVRCARQGDWKGWVLLGAGFGLGALAKGPAVLPHLLFVPLLGPLWVQSDAWRNLSSWRHWWMRLAAAGSLGTVIAAAWAVPALLDEGGQFAAALFRDQIGGRVVDAEDHGRALWWYFLAVPPALLPVLLWPAVWRGRKGEAGEPGVRFCIIWFVGAALSLSLISGKQLHYLLPSLPALALLAASRIDAMRDGNAPRGLALLAILVATLGIAIAAAPFIPLDARAADAVALAATGWGVPLALMALLAAVMKITSRLKQVITIAALSVASIVTIHLVVAPVLATRFDLRPVAARLGIWEGEGRALANYAEYHGQFHFLGRLQEPMAIVGDAEVLDWATEHPDGIVVTYQRSVPEGATPLLVHPFRGRLITVWPAKSVIGDPSIARRAP